MPKPIPTMYHGIIDYVAALTLILLPRLLGWSAPATILLTIMGIGLVAYSLITSYELGLLKWLPMTWHLALDALSGATLLVAAFLVPSTGNGEMIGLIILGIFELGAAMLTRTHVTREEPTLTRQQSSYASPYDRPPRW